MALQDASVAKIHPTYTGRDGAHVGQYDKYPVRNQYGHIEYLTREEIENLQDRGEGIEVLDDRPTKGPPIAKNPANQAFINEQWEKAQAEKRAKRQGRGGGRGGRGSTMYDRRARSGSEPSGARGEVNLPSGEGHGSQYYEDGYRLSRDTDGQGDDRVHWTNQNVGKKNRNRHTPPPDAR